MKLLFLIAAVAACAAAQGPTDVPPILQVVRKPGTGFSGTLRPYNGAKVDRALASPALRASAYEQPAQEDLLAPTRTMILLYQPGWSYRPREAVRRFPRAHYFHVSIYRMRAGAEEMDSVNLDRPDLVYRVVSGAPSGTYIILAPLVSLRVMDHGVAKLPVYAEPLATAEAAVGKSAASQELSREHFLSRVEPGQSYVSQEFSAVDPEFWRGKS